MHSHKMHIACPNCQAVYDVPQSKLGTDTALRCSLCQYGWTLHSAPPEAQQPPSPTQEQLYTAEMASAIAQPEARPAPEPYQPGPPQPLGAPAQTETNTPDYVVRLSKNTKATTPHPNPKRTGQPNQSASSVLLGGAALVLAALTIALLARHGIVKAFPASASFFKALGIS